MKQITVVTLLSLFFLAGCATTQKPMYAWGDYSSSLYDLKKNPCDETLKNHKKVLLGIIEESNKSGRRVPPGVYCEYGYILLKEGKTDNAVKYFDLEEKIYPESEVFVQRLKTQFVKAKEQP